MTILVSSQAPKKFAAESGHWYGRDGSPQYTIIGANGKERATTKRDAKKFGWVPSVTTVMQDIAKKGLERYKAEQLLMSALTLPRLPAESEATWIDRVWDDSRQHAIKAAERGTEIHAAIELSLTGREAKPEMDHFVNAAWGALEPLGQQEWCAEKSFASPLGYGGKVDLHAHAFVLDFKTKDGDLTDVKCWDEHFMQVAAYAQGLGRPGARCGIVFVSRTHPGLARLVMHSAEETTHGWAMFKALLLYWQEAHEYAPVWTL